MSASSSTESVVTPSATLPSRHVNVAPTMVAAGVECARPSSRVQVPSQMAAAAAAAAKLPSPASCFQTSVATPTVAAGTSSASLSLSLAAASPMEAAAVAAARLPPPSSVSLSTVVAAQPTEADVIDSARTTPVFTSAVGPAPSALAPASRSIAGSRRVPAVREPVVVLGAGVVGISTAYFLSCHGVRVTLVDRVGIAPAASGKAGGFLAKDWVTPALAPLAAASFSLHESLATRLGVDAVDYRRLGATSVTLRRPTKALRKSLGRPFPDDHPAWVDTPACASGARASWRSIAATRTGTVATCAQVHPAKLCRALVAAADNVELVIAAAVGLVMERARHQ